MFKITQNLFIFLLFCISTCYANLDETEIRICFAEGSGIFTHFIKPQTNMISDEFVNIRRIDARILEFEKCKLSNKEDSECEPLFKDGFRLRPSYIDQIKREIERKRIKNFGTSSSIHVVALYISYLFYKSLIKNKDLTNPSERQKILSTIKASALFAFLELIHFILAYNHILPGYRLDGEFEGLQEMLQTSENFFSSTLNDCDLVYIGTINELFEPIQFFLKNSSKASL